MSETDEMMTEPGLKPLADPKRMGPQNYNDGASTQARAPESGDHRGPSRAAAGLPSPHSATWDRECGSSPVAARMPPVIEETALAVAAAPTGGAALADPLAPPMRICASRQEATIARRWRTIEPCLAHARGSAERPIAVATAAQMTRVDPRSIYRWLSAYELEGMVGLANRQPRNARQPRIFVSRKFDRAYRDQGEKSEVLALIGQEITQRIADIWASAAQRAGVTDVRRRAQEELRLIAKRFDLSLPDKAFRLSRRRVEALREYRQVDVYLNDKTKFKDGQPHVLRDWSRLLPMTTVTADVKYVDVRVGRPDGTIGYPKIVCFRDDATRRVFVHPILLPGRRGVRQEHVIEGFLAMVRDPLWGFPETIYMDNGTEFACLDRLTSAFSRMAHQSLRAGQPIIKAKPYHANAKSVESSHASLDLYVFSTMPGYCGSDRMKKKTQNQGREPDAFDGSWNDFRETLQLLVKGFNARPPAESEDLPSPVEVLQRHIDDGWRPKSVEDEVLDAAFCKWGETRQVDRGAISISNRRHYHQAFDSLPHRTELNVVLPWREGALPMAELPDGSIVYVVPDVPYHPHDDAGAKEAHRRQHNYLQAAATRKSRVRPYDAVAASKAIAQKAPSPPPPDWVREVAVDERVVLVSETQKEAKRDRAKAPAGEEMARRKEANQSGLIEKEVDLGRYFQR